MKNVKLKITADTKDAKRGLDSVDNSIKNTVKSLALATAGVVAFKKSFDFLVKSTKAAIEQEQIFRDLRSTIELTGNSYEKAEDQLNNLFSTLQKTTKYGDTDSAKMLQNLITFSGNYEKSLKYLTLAQDMASTSAFNADSAARYLGMAIAGNIEMLGRYVPQLKSSNNELLKTMTQAEKTEYALKILQDRFGGMAEKELKTTSGTLAQFKNYWGDLQESIGDAFLPLVNKFLPEATKAIRRLLGDMKQKTGQGIMGTILGMTKDELLSYVEAQKLQIQTLDSLVETEEERAEIFKNQNYEDISGAFVTQEAKEEYEQMLLNIESYKDSARSKENMVNAAQRHLGVLIKEEENADNLTASIIALNQAMDEVSNKEFKPMLELDRDKEKANDFFSVWTEGMEYIEDETVSGLGHIFDKWNEEEAAMLNKMQQAGGLMSNMFYEAFGGSFDNIEEQFNNLLKRMLADLVVSGLLSLLTGGLSSGFGMFGGGGLFGGLFGAGSPNNNITVNADPVLLSSPINNIKVNPTPINIILDDAAISRANERGINNRVLL